MLNEIFFTGDLVSNLNLAPYLAKHKQIMAKDKKAIMTSVYSKVSRCCCRVDFSVLVHCIGMKYNQSRRSTY